MTEENGHLYVNVPERPKYELLAETPERFFLKIRPWTVTFVKEGGQVTQMEIADTGITLKAPRVE